MTIDARNQSDLAPPPSSTRTRPMLVLAVVLVAALAINVETTIVNVALPTLNSALGASTRGLQWIVDAYNLAFAALVLAGGTLGDRYGRRGTLVAGLALFTAGSVAAALSGSTGWLVAFRVVMGVASALIFPTTLAIITDTFRDPRRRAAAIGVWGAVTGLGVAVGPILGGALLERFWWGSLFLALAPIALAAMLGALFAVPASKQENAPSLDRNGLLLSVVVLGALVYSIIEAPDRGWTAVPTLIGFATATVGLVAFVAWERRCGDPLIDVALFANLRFSAASGAVTVAFFALFGFIFLITQFFQLLRGYGPLETGLRILPVAVSIAVGSVLGTRIAVTRIGTKTVVVIGLLMLGAAFGWVATAAVDVSYAQIVGQMLLLGGGLGLTTAPATDSIMGVVRPDQAGAGSAVNDATRQIGGTLGVAVLGSIFSSLYTRGLSESESMRSAPEPVQAVAREGLAQGLRVAAQSPPDLAPAMRSAVSDAFMSGLHGGCLAAAAVCLAGSVFALRFLPAHPVPAVRA